MENHHIAGQHNDVFTVPLQANDHRFVSDLQKDWPITTLQNKNESPLLQIAATIRGVMDMLKLFIERVMGWIPEKLEQLNSLLSENDDQWWVTIGFSGVSI